MSRDYHRKNKISGQFSWRTIAMMESPAFQVLSLSGRRVLDRLEIEHAHHGGNDNGQLPVTYDQFIEYGIHRNAVSPAIREVEALGFVKSPNGDAPAMQSGAGRTNSGSPIDKQAEPQSLTNGAKSRRSRRLK